MPTELRTADFEFELPPELIAQEPAARRDESRLLAVDRAAGRLEHRRFPDLLDYLRSGDVLVMTSSAKRPTVGKLNSEIAIRVLAEEGFSVMASSLGGQRGVNIIFNTETGEVLLQRHS